MLVYTHKESVHVMYRLCTNSSCIEELQGAVRKLLPGRLPDDGPRPNVHVEQRGAEVCAGQPDGHLDVRKIVKAGREQPAGEHSFLCMRHAPP